MRLVKNEKRLFVYLNSLGGGEVGISITRAQALRITNPRLLFSRSALSLACATSRNASALHTYVAKSLKYESFALVLFFRLYQCFYVICAQHSHSLRTLDFSKYLERRGALGRDVTLVVHVPDHSLCAHTFGAYRCTVTRAASKS